VHNQLMLHPVKSQNAYLKSKSHLTHNKISDQFIPHISASLKINR